MRSNSHGVSGQAHPQDKSPPMRDEIRGEPQGKSQHRDRPQPATSALATVQLQLDTVVPLHAQRRIRKRSAPLACAQVRTSRHGIAWRRTLIGRRGPHEKMSRSSVRRAGNHVALPILPAPVPCARRGFLHLLESVHRRSRERRALLPVVSASLRRHTVQCRCLATCGRTAKECTRTHSSEHRGRVRCKEYCCISRC
jgi:hypothetical protein